MEIDDVDVPIGGPDAVGKRVEIPCGSLRVVQKEEVRKIFDRCKRDFDASHELERGQMERVKKEMERVKKEMESVRKENLDLYEEKCKLAAALEIERGDRNRLKRLEHENEMLAMKNSILHESLRGTRIEIKTKDFEIEQLRLRLDEDERLRARVELESRADQVELRRARALLWYLH
jgi:Zn finger protein HypA/HybF involved in hydrogenase expression